VARLTWSVVDGGWVAGDYQCVRIHQDKVGRWRWQAKYKGEPIAPVQCLMRSYRSAQAHAKENVDGKDG